MNHNKIVRYYILGDVKRPRDMSRLEAERHIRCWNFYFRKEKDKDSESYNNSVCVMHLESEVYDYDDHDHCWTFRNYSLFQKSDGMYFTVYDSCTGYGGCMELGLELESDYFITHTLSDFTKLYNGKINVSKEDLNKLFEKRTLTFYAERWCSYDYKVLFGDLAYGNETKDGIKDMIERYHKKFSDCPDKEVLYKHVEEEAKKAFDAIDAGIWPEKDNHRDYNVYNPVLAEYKH